MLVRKITGNVEAENSSDVHARVQAFLELLIEVSSGKRYYSLEEAVASYANKMYTIERENRKTDIPAAKGT